jgi:hypothetical protein
MEHGKGERSYTKWIILAACLIGLYLAYSVRAKNETLRTVMDWGRLVHPPASAKNFIIKDEGNMFTRSFRASFTAPMADVEQWLRDSPGTRDVAPKRPSPTVRFFRIEPGAGATRAEVRVKDSGEVKIYVSWS